MRLHDVVCSFGKGHMAEASPVSNKTKVPNNYFKRPPIQLSKRPAIPLLPYIIPSPFIYVPPSQLPPGFESEAKGPSVEQKLTEQIIELQKNLAEEKQKQKESTNTIDKQLKIIRRLENQLGPNEPMTDSVLEKSILNEEIRDLKAIYKDLEIKYKHLYSVYEMQRRYLIYDYLAVFGISKPSELP